MPICFLELLLVVGVYAKIKYTPIAPYSLYDGWHSRHEQYLQCRSVLIDSHIQAF